jgi:hypothetical protein
VATLLAKQRVTADNLEFLGETFSFWQPDENTEPGVILEGATKLPISSDETALAAVRYWCALLWEIRRVVPDARSGMCGLRTPTSSGMRGSRLTTHPVEDSGSKPRPSLIR